ncbi:hypothetical protein [Rhodococcus qingshengii]|uniref:hypothetical protein n=1 Tax=Rhodococcus qingshengii TaxID=334542 RepID=UPI0035E1ECD4
MEIIYHDVNRFAAIPNETIDDSDSLDLPALGMLTVFLRHRSGWTVTLDHLSRKYGHGETALANMMGQLQVARYVVKLRVQEHGTGLLSVKIIVSSAPLTDQDIQSYVSQVSAHETVRSVTVMPPGKEAVRRAKERRAKLAERKGRSIYRKGKQGRTT